MLGQWLTDKRRRAGLTQEELAQRVPCTRSYISSLERNVVEAKSGRPIQPSREFVQALARALGIPINEAFTAAGYAPTDLQINKQSQLLNWFDPLPDARKEEVLAFCELWFTRYATQSHKEFEILS